MKKKTLWLLVMGSLLFSAPGCDDARGLGPSQKKNPARPQPTLQKERKPPVDLAQAIKRGRDLFSGQGNCVVCHTIDGSQKEGRGPDLKGMGSRAAARAKEFGLKGPKGATQYLIRAIIRPGDDVVKGMNPMPESYLPSGLSNEDIRNLVLFLQSQGGEPKSQEVVLPKAWLAAKRQDYRDELALFTSYGDPKQGRLLFENPKSNAGCIKCHTIDGKGKDICPDLTKVHLVQRPLYVLHSILDSSAFIVHGYQQVMIWDEAGILHVGLPKQEDEDTITLVIDDDGNTEEIYKEDIDEQRPSKVSRMPGNFAELLTAQQVMNIAAFVLSHHRQPAAVVSKQGGAAAGGTKAFSKKPSFEVMLPPSAAQTAYRSAMGQGDPHIGSRLYAHYCSMCHGADGQGRGFNAVNLDTKPANHTDNRRMAKIEDRLLFGVVNLGGIKTGRSYLMPPWGGTFKQREIWDLVAFMRTLHTNLK